MIYEPNDQFNFEHLHIGKPISASSGIYKSKYTVQGEPLYIQPPKCNIKQMITKAGKRMYCDLVFDQENEQFIRWMENLENTSQKMIYQNRDKWFQTELELDDIENSFTSPMKIYKSGRSYIIRTNIPLGNSGLKIYDEDENDIAWDDIKEGSQVMVILEVQCIRCSARSFQIDIEIKQMMIMKPSNLFNTCVLKKKSATSAAAIVEPVLGKTDSMEENKIIHTDKIENPLDETKNENIFIVKKDPEIPQTSNEIPEQTMQIDTITEEMNELKEIDFDLDKMPADETVAIKQRNDVYYKMYQEAREKAKVARDLALSAYLEAKRIKNTYLLDDIIDSSSSDEDEDEDDDEDDDEDNEEEN